MSVRFKLATKSIVWDIQLTYKISYVIGDSGSGKTHLYSCVQEYDKYALDLNPDIKVWSWDDFKLALGIPEISVTSTTQTVSYKFSYPEGKNVIVIDEVAIENIRKNNTSRNFLMQWIKESENSYWVFITRNFSNFISTHIPAVYKLVTVNRPVNLYRGFSKISSTNFKGASKVEYKFCKTLQPMYSFKSFESSRTFSQLITEDSGGGG